MGRPLAVAAGLIVVSLALAGCYPRTAAAPGPLASEALEIAKVRWADTSPEALEQGRQIFLKACNECHGYPDVVAFPEDRWPATAREMGEKSNLQPADSESMTRFILALRASLTRPAAAPAAAPAAP